MAAISAASLCKKGYRSRHVHERASSAHSTGSRSVQAVRATAACQVNKEFSMYRRYNPRPGDSIFLISTNSVLVAVDVLNLSGALLHLGVKAPADYPCRPLRRGLKIGGITLSLLGPKRPRIGVEAPGSFSIALVHSGGEPVVSEQELKRLTALPSRTYVLGGVPMGTDPAPVVHQQVLPTAEEGIPRSSTAVAQQRATKGRSTVGETTGELIPPTEQRAAIRATTVMLTALFAMDQRMTVLVRAGRDAIREATRGEIGLLSELFDEARLR
jgi:hypothetical protein